jgi:hypothetical protein
VVFCGIGIEYKGGAGREMIGAFIFAPDFNKLTLLINTEAIRNWVDLVSADK